MKFNTTKNLPYVNEVRARGGLSPMTEDQFWADINDTEGNGFSSFGDAGGFDFDVRSVNHWLVSVLEKNYEAGLNLMIKLNNIYGCKLWIVQ